MAEKLPRASLIEGVRFTAQVAVPNVVQGLFRRRPKAVAVACKLDLDGHAVGLVEGLRRRHGRRPLWIRVAKDESILVYSPEDVRRVLEGAPSPFAADPDAKKRGMGHFQPEGLTISRGAAWETRRRFAVAVLDTGKLHRFADRFRAVAQEEGAALLAEAERSSERKLEFDPFNRAGRRITRRVILGDAARDDDEVSELLAKLMDEANSMPKERTGDTYDRFMDKVRRYVNAAEPGSLASLFGEAPAPADTKLEGQAVHWLFALGDTMPANAFRTLALIASHPRQRGEVDKELAAADLSTAEGVAGLSYLDACIEEAMRLWPTTAMLSRVTTEDVRWNGDVLPQGTQIFIVNTFNHRDRETYDFADRFAPEAWIEGHARDDWFFNHFSHGPQGCPGAGMTLFIAKALLAELLTTRQFRLLAPKLNPDKPLPHMFDYYSEKLAVEPKRGAPPTAGAAAGAKGAAG
jgi:cytochrome P450